MNDQYLAHHGIKGMKWGVRRYRNKDGTLTAAGKKKYYTESKDHANLLQLSKAGRAYNSQQNEQVKRLSDATIYNAAKMNPEFNKKLSELKQLDSSYDTFFKKCQDKASRKEPPFNKSMHKTEFIDTVGNLYYKTPEGKKRVSLRNDVGKILVSAAQEHPLYNKPYNQLSNYIFKDETGDVHSYETIGKAAVTKAEHELFYYK